LKTYIEYDRSKGHPSDYDLFYECVRCGGFVSSMHIPEIEDCPCGNLHKEPGRLGTLIGDEAMRLVRITDASPTEFQTETRSLPIDETSVKAAERDLMEAANAGGLSRVRALLAANADVNAKANNGFTSLMIAAQQGSLDVVRVLLAANADVDAKTNKGFTSLMIASQQGHLEVVRALLAANADVNAKTDCDMTSLMIASQLWHLNVVEALLAAGADASAKTFDGVTALRLASMHGHLNVVRALPPAIYSERVGGIRGMLRRLFPRQIILRALGACGERRLSPIYPLTRIGVAFYVDCRARA
jgi:hypothetical protein